MKSLLIVAHGSRRAASNHEVKELVERVRQRPDLAFDDVDYAFLELAEPSVGDALACSARRGAKEVTVFPYFLAAGRHVVLRVVRLLLSNLYEIAPGVSPDRGFKPT